MKQRYRIDAEYSEMLEGVDAGRIYVTGAQLLKALGLPADATIHDITRHGVRAWRILIEHEGMPFLPDTYCPVTRLSVFDEGGEFLGWDRDE